MQRFKKYLQHNCTTFESSTMVKVFGNLFHGIINFCWSIMIFLESRYIYGRLCALQRYKSSGKHSPCQKSNFPEKSAVFRKKSASLFTIFGVVSFFTKIGWNFPQGECDIDFFLHEIVVAQVKKKPAYNAEKLTFLSVPPWFRWWSRARPEARSSGLDSIATFFLSSPSQNLANQMISHPMGSFFALLT